MKKSIAHLCLTWTLFLYLPSLFAADNFKGAEVYQRNCESCHGVDGRGVVPNSPNFKFGQGLWFPDQQLFAVISSGKGIMPGYRGMLSEQDILNVISYLRTMQR